MKLKFKDKLLLIILAIFVFAMGFVVILLSAQLNEITLTENGNFFTLHRILIFVGGLCTMGCAVYFLSIPRRLRGDKKEFVVQQTDNGELRISVKAIENLVHKCIQMHDEIHVESMKIHNARDGVVIDLRISLANNISIPLAVASLQKQIKQYLSVSSGIEVSEVRVSVETALDSAHEKSPYLVEEDMSVPTEEEIKKAEEEQQKKPMHQRIFSHEDHHKKENHKEEVKENVTSEVVENIKEEVQEEKTEVQEELQKDVQVAAEEVKG